MMNLKITAKNQIQIFLSTNFQRHLTEIDEIKKIQRIIYEESSLIKENMTNVCVCSN
jgi:hypothetical protein